MNVATFTRIPDDHNSNRNIQAQLGLQTVPHRLLILIPRFSILAAIGGTRAFQKLKDKKKNQALDV